MSLKNTTKYKFDLFIYLIQRRKKKKLTTTEPHSTRSSEKKTNQRDGLAAPLLKYSTRFSVTNSYSGTAIVFNFPIRLSICQSVMLFGYCCRNAIGAHILYWCGLSVFFSFFLLLLLLLFHFYTVSIQNNQFYISKLTCLPCLSNNPPRITNKSLEQIEITANRKCIYALVCFCLYIIVHHSREWLKNIVTTNKR